MKHLLRLFALATAAAVAILPASAQDRQTKSTDSQSSDQTTTTADNPNVKSLKTLLDDGFEIKAVTIIPHDIVTRGGSTTDVDAVMIVVQRGPEIANCYVTFTGFADGTYYNGTVPICTVLE